MSADNRLPHEILLAIARGEVIDGHTPSLAERIAAARIAAPFYAPRLANVTHEAAGGGQVIVGLVQIEIVDPKAPGGSGTLVDDGEARAV